MRKSYMSRTYESVCACVSDVHSWHCLVREDVGPDKPPNLWPYPEKEEKAYEKLKAELEASRARGEINHYEMSLKQVQSEQWMPFCIARVLYEDSIPVRIRTCNCGAMFRWVYPCQKEGYDSELSRKRWLVRNPNM